MSIKSILTFTTTGFWTSSYSKRKKGRQVSQWVDDTQWLKWTPAPAFVFSVSPPAVNLSLTMWLPLVFALFFSETQLPSWMSNCRSWECIWRMPRGGETSLSNKACGGMSRQPSPAPSWKQSHEWSSWEHVKQKSLPAELSQPTESWGKMHC